MTNPLDIPSELEELIKSIQDILDMQTVVMREKNGRPDCKNCSLAETIQELLNKFEVK